MIKTDTICAVATGKSSGAISVIRISGEQAFSITDNIFVGKTSKKISEQKTQTIHFGSIYNNEYLLDEVLISIFKAPKSYTGEDMVEISCHGSLYIQQSVLQLIISKGARLATAGEFTLRAYNNGKIDLAQAEAVADLIASQSKVAHQVAISQMRGGISNQLQELRQELLNFISLIELELDFSEEDVEFADRTQLKQLLNNIYNIIYKLIETFDKGNAIKNGVPVAIIGEPNVGKSTLLNAILSEDKAIVSDIPGTTRDIIEDTFNINGVSYRFFDTAGLRQTANKIETIGIERTYKKIEQAKIVLAMFDANDDEKKISKNINEILKKIKDNTKVILVINKTDLQKDTNSYDNFDKKISAVVEISAKNNKNIDKLLNCVDKVFDVGKIDTEEIIISNVRHYEALSNAKKSIKRTLNGLDENVSGDFLAMDIREAIFYLAGITGEEITTDEILGNIFSKFCIGK